MFFSFQAIIGAVVAVVVFGVDGVHEVLTTVRIYENKLLFDIFI